MPLGTGASHDIHSKGFAKYTHNIKPHATAGNVVAHADPGSAIFSGLQEVLPFPLLALVLAVIGVVFHVPQICGCKEFWKNCFTECRWWYPPRNWIMDIINFVVNIHWVVVITRFLYDKQTFAPNSNDHIWYFAIFMLFMVALIVRYWWTILFYNYHKKSYALGVAIGLAVLMVLLSLVITILLGVRHAWVSFGLSIPILIWNVLILSWSITVYQCFSNNVCKPWSPTFKSCPMPESKQPMMTETNNQMFISPLSTGVSQRNRK